jgi:hypothetical protein
MTDYDFGRWTLIAAVMIGVALIGLIVWEVNTRVCLRTEPGTCWTVHAPTHLGPYPCQVCTEWGHR